VSPTRFIKLDAAVWSNNTVPEMARNISGATFDLAAATLSMIQQLPPGAEAAIRGSGKARRAGESVIRPSGNATRWTQPSSKRRSRAFAAARMDVFEAASTLGQAAISPNVRPQPLQIPPSTLQMLVQGEGGTSVMDYVWPALGGQESSPPLTSADRASRVLLALHGGEPRARVDARYLPGEGIRARALANGGGFGWAALCARVRWGGKCAGGQGIRRERGLAAAELRSQHHAPGNRQIIAS